MKTKRILSAIMSAVMVFTMFAVLTLVATVSAPVGVSAASATATTKAIYVGPSTRYANNVPSGIFLPLEKSNKYGDDTIVEITADVKMLKGTKPYVQMMRTATSSSTGTVSSSAGSVVFYQGDSNNGTTNKTWQDNNTSRIDSDGIFHCYVRLDDIPGVDNCFYSSVWDGGTEYRKTNISGRSTPIGCGVYIGNAVLNDDISVYGTYHDLSMEFLIKDIHIKVTTLSGGSGGSVGMDLAPAETTLNTDARYFFVGDSKMGNRPDAKNHPLNGRLDQWNICSPDEDTVRQVTVADDIFDGGTHTYTKHNETNDEFEYYTCSDFGNDVNFEKIGNCYSRYLDDDVAKKAFIIKSHAGDSKELTSNQGSSTVANIFIPLNIHKFYSAYNASTCGAKDLREDGTAVRFGVSFKARRISGTGQPVVGVAYADGNANGASGTSYKDAEFGAPREYGKDRSYNNGLEKSGSRTKQSDWVSSSYNASTGEFTALLSTESGYYKQMSRDGKSAYISIGLAEHLNSSLEALNTDSTFVISDIKFTVYDLNNSSTVKFSGENQAPKMCKANCDTETPYQYGQLWDYNEKVNGIINVGVRNAPLNKYSVDGAIQNVFLIDSNACNRNGCTLDHHAATDTTVEYWSCATHHASYKDEFASEALSSVSATKKMIVVNKSGNSTYGAFIPLDNDGWVGGKYFIFKCKMKVFGDSIPIITGYRAGYWGGIGTFYPGGDDERTKQVAKDGTVTKWVNYDPATSTYTAAFYMWRADPKGYNQFKYYNSANGAHSAIMLGNFVPTSGQNPGVTSNCYTTGFAFTDPEIYEASNAATGTYTGSNLCTPVTDKTVDFSTSYKYSACTQLNGAGEWTDRAENTLMNAPLRTWSKYSTTTRIALLDIPSGYFNGTAQTRTLRASGPTNTSNVVVASYENFIDSNTTYQFDLDYSVFGGAEPRILIQTATTSGYGNDVQEYANDTVNGNHITYEFTTGSLRNTGDGNFRIQLGVDSATQNKQTTVYFANASLRKKTGSALGPNHLINGDFSLTPDSFNGVYNTDMTNSEIADTIPYWSAGSDSTYTIGAVKGSQKYRTVVLLADSGYIFGNKEATGKSNIAVKFSGHASFGSQLQFFAGLKPNKTYRLTFNYRSNGDEPEVFAVSTKSGIANPTVTCVSRWTGRNTFSAHYDITTGSDYDYTPNSSGNANTRIIFKIGGFSQGKDLYMSGVTLYERSGSSNVGINIAGELNPLLPDGVYDSVIPNTGDTYPVLYSQDGGNNFNRFVAVGWYGFNQADNYTAVNGAVVKVSSEFFTRNAYGTRIKNLRKAIIGTRSSDPLNPDYDPNDDGTKSDIKDIVHMKIKALNYESSTTGYDGAAKATADYMLENVIDVKNDSSGYVSGGNVWYVSTSGSDSNNGKSASAPFATLSKANSSASAGDTIYLKRGDTFRNTSLTADYAFEFKAGVNYAAYGSGNKPVLSGSAKNYASNAWYETSSGSHIWYTTYNSGTKSTNTNAAMIYFYDNKGNLSYGKSIAKKDTSTTYAFSASDLDSDLEYFAPYKSGTNTLTLSGLSVQGRIYVYSNANPTTRFSRIEIATDHRAVVQAQSGTSAKITKVNNIAVMYGGVHGIKGVSGGSNVFIQKCEVAYIGGGFSHESSEGWSRLGNGVEFGDGYTNGRVYDSYVHDCYDAGVTFQSYGSSSSAYTFSYIYFERNVIERCTYNIEFFTKKSSDRMWNISFSNNVLRNAGYGWGSYNRCDDGWRISNICGSKNNYMQVTTEGNGDKFKIENNVFDGTRMSHVMWYWNSSESSNTQHANMQIGGNIYFQKKGAMDSIDTPNVMNYGRKTTDDNTTSGHALKRAYSRAALVEAVATFDNNPGGVYWLDDNY